MNKADSTLAIFVKRFAKSRYIAKGVSKFDQTAMGKLRKSALVFSWILLVVLAGCQNSVELQAAEEAEEDASIEAEPIEVIPVQGDSTTVGNPGKSYEQIIMSDNTVIEYALVLPDNYEAGQTYPVLLAFPPGDQSEAMVEAGLGGYWEAEAAKRGWIVVSPVAPDFILFFRVSESLLPEFFERFTAEFPPEGGKVHVAGISNGGISAFRFSIGNPDLVHSIVVLPGYPLGDFDQENLANLVDIPVAMFVGENDTSWVSRMEDTEKALSDLGATVTLEVVPGEGHVIRSISGEQLFDLLESFR